MDFCFAKNLNRRFKSLRQKQKQLQSNWIFYFQEGVQWKYEVNPAKIFIKEKSWRALDFIQERRFKKFIGFKYFIIGLIFYMTDILLPKPQTLILICGCCFEQELVLFPKRVIMKKCILTLTAILLILFSGCKPSSSALMGLIGRPHISPDGTKIVFIHAINADTDVWEIYSANIDGSNLRQLTNFPEARIKKGPVWSPDGKRIVFHGDLAEGAQIFVMDSIGQNLKQLTNLPGYNVEPHWSPDGTKIIFNQSIPSDGTVEMLMMNSDGSNITVLPNLNGQNWYPRMITNKKLLFTSDVNHTDFYDIFLMKIDSTEITQLTSTLAINWFPECSPDGKKIAFTSNRDDPELSDSGNYNIYIMDIDGTNIQRLTDMPGQELHPKWHPSGEKLIFERHNDGPLGIYLLDIQSGEIDKIQILK